MHSAHDFRHRQRARSIAEDDQTYWLRRANEELRMALAATDSRAKLAHLDLSGRYSIRALLAPFETAAPPSTDDVAIAEAPLIAIVVPEEPDRDCVEPVAIVLQPMQGA